MVRGMSGSFVVLLSFAMAFGLAAISPEFIIVFLGDEYQQTVGLLIILCITIPLIGWNNYVRTQIGALKGRPLPLFFHTLPYW